MTSSVLRSLVPLALALLELVHPAWNGGSVSDAVRAAGAWWIALHVALMIGYALLAVVLQGIARTRLARAMLLFFAICNTVYLAVDGIAIGVLAQSDPTLADTLWSATWVTLLADATGAAWAAALLLLALSLRPARDWLLGAGTALTWLAFVASAVPSISGPAVILSRVAALGSGAWSVYQRGSADIPLALFIFAAVSRQHVGAEAALGLVFVAIATGRSIPAAASQP